MTRVVNFKYTENYRRVYISCIPLNIYGVRRVLYGATVCNDRIETESGYIIKRLKSWKILRSEAIKRLTENPVIVNYDMCSDDTRTHKKTMRKFMFVFGTNSNSRRPLVLNLMTPASESTSIPDEVYEGMGQVIGNVIPRLSDLARQSEIIQSNQITEGLNDQVKGAVRAFISGLVPNILNSDSDNSDTEYVSDS